MIRFCILQRIPAVTLSSTTSSPDSTNERKRRKEKKPSSKYALHHFTKDRKQMLKFTFLELPEGVGVSPTYRPCSLVDAKVQGISLSACQGLETISLCASGALVSVRARSINSVPELCAKNIINSEGKVMGFARYALFRCVN